VALSLGESPQVFCSRRISQEKGPYGKFGQGDIDWAAENRCRAKEGRLGALIKS
jgi:hypothetical protein